MLDTAAIRADFPLLSTTVRGGKPLVYLDSAATSQKPRQVLDAERDFYETANASVHRGAHALAERATEHYEQARRNIAAFVGAEPEGLVFLRNATEAVNLVAYSLSNSTSLHARGREVDSRFRLAEGDEIVVTEMEHHSNLVPWQQLCERTGAVLKFIPLTDAGRLDLDHLSGIIGPRTRLVAAVHQSNILGTLNPVVTLARAAHSVGALFLVDACQSAPHLPLDFGSLEADFLVMSGHKMLGPTGIGALVARPELLDSMTPFLYGGSMIETVHLESSTFAKGPQRFEAGTPNVAQAHGWSAAVDYLRAVGMSAVAEHEHRLTSMALEGLRSIDGVRVIGPSDNVERGAAISFAVSGVHPHDVGQFLDNDGIAVRVGHHCAWPVCRRYGVPATTRASFYLYNNEEEVRLFLDSLVRVPEYFGVK